MSPYRFGGTGPSRFDRSGHVQYALAGAGAEVPRTADERLRAATRIPRSKARAGGLVFFVAAGPAFNNGIHVGDGMMDDVPRSGRSVTKRAIWFATAVDARVTR
jgi:cell wall-associated NlpC family hydrolase